MKLCQLFQRQTWHKNDFLKDEMQYETLSAFLTPEMVLKSDWLKDKMYYETVSVFLTPDMAPKNDLLKDKMQYTMEYTYWKMKWSMKLCQYF